MLVVIVLQQLLKCIDNEECMGDIVGKWGLFFKVM